MIRGLVRAAAVAGLMALAGCLGDIGEATRVALEEDIPDVRLHQVEVTEVKDGVRQWHLKAAQAEYERASGLGRLSEVEVTFYPSSGAPVLVRSRRGTFDSRARELQMMGDVRGHTDSFRLFSDDLHYTPKDKCLDTPGPARLESAGLAVAGRGLHYDLESRQLSIREDAQTVSAQHLF